jgi:hypothetical protein
MRFFLLEREKQDRVEVLDGVSGNGCLGDLIAAAQDCLFACALILFFLPLIASYVRLYQSLRCRLLFPVVLRFKDVLPSLSGLEVVWVIITVSPAQSRSHHALFFSLSTIPGRRMLFTEFSVFANFSKDVKYTSPGLYKGKTEKHDDIILFSNRVINAHGGLEYRAQEIWMGCHKQRTSHITPPIS